MDEQRYSRIWRLPDLGTERFGLVRKAQIALVGCGTLGGIMALNLARIGIAALRLIDRDIVEEHNLSTQLLFDEEDAQAIQPKSMAAQRHLRKINSACEITSYVADLTSANAEHLLAGVDLILDGTDNFETRYLINDLSLHLGIPWIYSGVLGWSGAVMAVIPGKTACLRCLMKDPPDAENLPTCETDGIWPPTAQSIAAIALTEALGLLVGGRREIQLHELNLASQEWRKVAVPRKSDCPACIQNDLVYLRGDGGLQAIKMCGRDMVHLTPPHKMQLDLNQVAQRLRGLGEIKVNAHLLQAKMPEAEIYLFADGRAFVKGISDAGRARAVFSRYLGL